MEFMSKLLTLLKDSHKRLLDRLLLFAHSILNYENSPPKLKEIIKLPDNSTNYTEIDQYNSPFHTIHQYILLFTFFSD